MPACPLQRGIEDVLRCRVLIVEMTFLDDEVTIDEAREKGHMHLADFVAHAHKLQVRSARRARVGVAWALSCTGSVRPSTVLQRHSTVLQRHTGTYGCLGAWLVYDDDCGAWLVYDDDCYSMCGVPGHRCRASACLPASTSRPCE